MAIAVSTAKVDITPGAGGNSYLAGYGGDTFRTATASYTPLYARCLVLWDGTKPHAIVTADVLAFPRSVHQSIRAQVIPLNSQWSSADFILAATHTHNGPVLSDDLDPYIAYGLTDLTSVNSYVDTLKTQIVTLVQTALAAPRTACTLDYTAGTQNFSANREGLSYNETAVPVLVARDADDMPRAVLFSYGCHPVAAGVQDKWDGDYPAAACAVVEAAIPHCFAMFMMGPAGDQDPNGVRDWNLRNKLGTQLANTVVAAASNGGRTVTGPFTTSYQEISLSLDITNTPANMAAVIAAFTTRLNNAALPAWYHRHAEKMIQEVNNNTFATALMLPIQVWKLPGSPTLRIAMTGGELVSGYGVYFRSRYGGANGLMIGAYANEVPCYVPSNELLRPIRSGGSYAGGWDTDFPGLAGGSMTVYGCLGQLKAGTGGVEQVLTAALTSALT